MKVAVLSDIHGNLEALKATLNDIKKRNVDKVICLGDIIARGHHPRQCINIVRAECDVVLRGNCDRFFSSTFDSFSSEIQEKRIRWIQSMLSKEDVKYLSSLPFSYEFYMSGSLVRLFHATPEKDDETVINQDSFQTKYKMFLPSKNTVSDKIADVVLYGHIHYPYFDSSLYNKTLINVGSVGNACVSIRNDRKDSCVLETTRATYFILNGEWMSREYKEDISYTFVKITYDIEKELEDVELNGEPQMYGKEIREGQFRNMKKIMENYKRLGVDIESI